MIVAIPISDKIDFKWRDKEGHYILIKVSIQQEGITLIHIYTSNNRLSNYMKQKLTECKQKMDSFPTVFEDFNTPPSIMISKEIEDLNNTRLNTIHNSLTIGHTFFSHVHRILSKIDHMLGYKLFQ